MMPRGNLAGGEPRWWSFGHAKKGRATNRVPEEWAAGRVKRTEDGGQQAAGSRQQIEPGSRQQIELRGQRSDVGGQE